MAQEKPNRLAEWLDVARSQVPGMRQRFSEWLAAVREEPVLLWHTPAVRYAVYGFTGIVLLWVVRLVPSMFGPPPPANARPAATTADFHVVCSDTQCGYHFLVHRQLGFRKFPIECPKCQRKTGTQARRCNSKTCQGRWVAPAKSNGTVYCPVCKSRFD